LQLFTCDALGPYEPSGKSVSDFHLDHEEWPGQTSAVAPGWGVFAMIKGVFAVSIAAALGLATLPVEVSAKGFGSQASHAVGPILFKGSPVRHHHRAFGYGGLIAAYTPGDAPLARHHAAPGCCSNIAWLARDRVPQCWKTSLLLRRRAVYRFYRGGRSR